MSEPGKSCERLSGRHWGFQFSAVRERGKRKSAPPTNNSPHQEGCDGKRGGRAVAPIYWVLRSSCKAQQEQLCSHPDRAARNLGKDKMRTALLQKHPARVYAWLLNKRIFTREKFHILCQPQHVSDDKKHAKRIQFAVWSLKRAGESYEKKINISDLGSQSLFIIMGSFKETS